MVGLKVVVAVSRGGEPGFVLELDRCPITIGASPRCDVVLDDPYVSRRHASVTVSRGRLLLTDSSANGTFFHGARVRSQSLESGDSVEIPPFELRFEYSVEGIEERGTSLRDLGQLLSPEIRQRMADGAPPSAAPEPAAAEDVFGALPSPAEVPEVQPAEGTPARPPEGSLQPDLQPGAVAETAVTPPPPAVPPRRPPASPGRPKAAPRAGNGELPPEPPTAALAAVRPRQPGSAPATNGEGTVHLPVEELMSPPNLALEVVDGPPELRGRGFPLPAREVTVGRGDQVDVRLELGNISRVHASLSPEGEEEWLLRDLASLNGTYVGGQRITQAKLRVGQEFRLANEVTLRLTPVAGAGGPDTDG